MIEPKLEGVMTVQKNKKLIAVVYHNTDNHSQEFYKCEKMGVEEIKNLLEDSNGISIKDEKNTTGSDGEDEFEHVL